MHYSSSLVPKLPNLVNSCEHCKDQQGALGRGYYRLLLRVCRRVNIDHCKHTNACHTKTMSNFCVLLVRSREKELGDETS